MQIISCAFVSIKLIDKYFDALFDAECCAQFAVRNLNGKEPDWELIDELYEQER